MTPEFLEVEHVLILHEEQIEEFGGTHGVRDLGLLTSAVVQPQSTFGGELLHSSLFDMAAAYLFHLVSNHPFFDGNKRVGLAAALVFLKLNGEPIRQSTSELYDLTLAVAQGRLGKRILAERLRDLRRREADC